MAHIDIQPVAYRGTTHLLPDLLAGRVTMSFANIVNILPLDVLHGMPPVWQQERPIVPTYFYDPLHFVFPAANACERT